MRRSAAGSSAASRARASASGSATSIPVARLSATALAASIGLPPPKEISASGSAARAAAAADETAPAGACWPTAPNSPTSRSPSSRRSQPPRRGLAATLRVVTRKTRRAPSRSRVAISRCSAQPAPQWSSGGLE